MTISDWYEKVNGEWPEVVPPLTPEEALKAAKQLYTVGMGQRWAGDVKLTSGNRYTWVRNGTLYVNPARKERIGGGWAALVHDLSHYAHWRVNRGVKPHSAKHARIEIKMIKKVVRSGWLEGKLKPQEAQPEPSKNDERQKKYEKVLASIKRWETKAKRAETFLKKLNRSKRALERHL